MRVKKALHYIRLLYRVEGWAKRKKMTPEQLLRLRRRYSARLLKSFKEWLKELMAQPDVLPKSLLCRAASYALSRWEALERYTTDARLSIDSNEIERAIRPVALGRKNWLFCASEVSSEAAAICYSLIASCKMAGVDPQLYLSDGWCVSPAIPGAASVNSAPSVEGLVEAEALENRRKQTQEAAAPLT